MEGLTVERYIDHGMLEGTGTGNPNWVRDALECGDLSPLLFFGRLVALQGPPTSRRKEKRRQDTSHNVAKTGLIPDTVIPRERLRGLGDSGESVARPGPPAGARRSRLTRSLRRTRPWKARRHARPRSTGRARATQSRLVSSSISSAAPSSCSCPCSDTPSFRPPLAGRRARRPIAPAGVSQEREP